MTNRASLCILYRDEAVEVAYIDRTVLGCRVRFAERLPRDEQVCETIAERLRAVEKPPARVVLCMPREQAMQRTLRYPGAAQADLAGLVRFEATRHVPLPEADRSLAWASAPSPDGRQVVLDLAAARSSEIRALVARFGEVGVPIDEVVPFASALVPFLGNAPTLLVVSDVRCVEFHLYGQGQLQASQSIRREAPGFGADRLVAAARQMAAMNKEWLGDEGIGRLLLAGNEPLPEDSAANLGAAFGLQARPLDPPEGVAAPADASLAGVLLAAASVLPASMNLAETSGRKIPVGRRTLLAYGLLVLLAVEMAAWFALRTGGPSLQRRRVAEELARMRRRAAPLQRTKERNRVMRRQLARLEAIGSEHVGSMELLLALSEALPDDTYLRSIVFGAGEGLRIRGHTKDPAALPERLQALPMVKAVSASDIGKKTGDYHEFSLSASLGRAE